MPDPTKPSSETRAAEREEMDAKHEADRAPSDDEAAAAPSHTSDPDVAAHEQEMAERGVDQQGEGRIP